jgi:hypothetical protein
VHVRLLVVGVLATAACSASRAETAAADSAKETEWHLRMELDSAPGRSPRARVVQGTIDPAHERYKLDFTPMLGRALEERVALSLFKVTGGPAPSELEITLGDPTSDRAKVILRGVEVRQDSIVGTWTEPSYCCRAAGRFAMWRTRR